MPWLRMTRRGRLHHRQQWVCRAKTGRAIAQPMHKRHRGPHGGWWLLFPSRFLQSSEINGPLKQRAPHAEGLMLARLKGAVAEDWRWMLQIQNVFCSGLALRIKVFEFMGGLI